MLEDITKNVRKGRCVWSTYRNVRRTARHLTRGQAMLIASHMHGDAA